MTYRPFDSFLQDYRTVLPSSRALEWNFRFQLATWLDGIVYYSFLQYSEEGACASYFVLSKELSDLRCIDFAVLCCKFFLIFIYSCHWFVRYCYTFRIGCVGVGSCWRFTCVHPAGVAQVLSLRSLYQMSFIRFCCLICHTLGIICSDYHRGWIFHTVILDENDQEVRFHLSGPNMHCQQLHPPLGRCAAMLVVCSLLSGKSLLKVGLFSNLRLCYGSICCFVLAGLHTSCLPSSISHEQTVLQFGHLHLPMV